MGLDMTLRRCIYVGNQYKDPKDQVEVKSKDGLVINQSKIVGITEEMGYWRKANAIHKWFVDNVQNGVDDCKEYFVSREQMKELLSLCKEVLEKSKLVDGAVKNGETLKDGVWIPNYEKGKRIENPEVAHKLLPTTEGFFFGSTDYDEYYYQDIERTIPILEEAIKDNTGNYYYQSSW